MNWTFVFYPIYTIVILCQLFQVISSSYIVSDRGDVYFINEGSQQFNNLSTATFLCQTIGGSLPVVTTKEDEIFMSSLSVTEFWLGGQYFSSYSSSCHHSCCGFVMTDRRKVVSVPCHTMISGQVCQMSPRDSSDEDGNQFRLKTMESAIFFGFGLLLSLQIICGVGCFVLSMRNNGSKSYPIKVWHKIEFSILQSTC